MGALQRIFEALAALFRQTPPTPLPAPVLPLLVTAEQLRAAFGCSEVLAQTHVQPLNAAMRRFGITSREEICRFLAQVGHETQRLARLRENLNYSAAGLAKTWPSRFRGPDGKPKPIALALHRQPELIANSVYADRIGNGPEESGDGWAFRGGGHLMLTGRFNYARAEAALGLPLTERPELLEQPEYGALAAGHFWQVEGLGAVTDMWENTRRLNGGTIGYDDRLALYDRLREVLDV